MRKETREILQRLADGAPAEGPDAGIFGCSVPIDDAALALIPVPWDATASYGKGAALGPQTILAASHQLDLFDEVFGIPFLAGITMLPEDMEIVAFNATARRAAEHGADDEPTDLDFVNETSESLHSKVYEQARKLARQGKLVAVVGGEHSAPYGLIKALAEKKKEPFGILHVDAHMDTRDAYEGFRHSHASIMRNAMTDFPMIQKLTHVAVRDYCVAERDFGLSLGERWSSFTSYDLFKRKAAGQTWMAICQEIVETLPERVYVSFDIDGLTPQLCPHTGTPVPGGLAFEEAVMLLECVAKSNRKVVGFDLCEVAPGPEGDEWDGNVGARLLYKLCGLYLHTQGKIK